MKYSINTDAPRDIETKNLASITLTFITPLLNSKFGNAFGMIQCYDS